MTQVQQHNINVLYDNETSIPQYYKYNNFEDYAVKKITGHAEQETYESDVIRPISVNNLFDQTTDKQLKNLLNDKDVQHGYFLLESRFRNFSADVPSNTISWTYSQVVGRQTLGNVYSQKTFNNIIGFRLNVIKFPPWIISNAYFNVQIQIPEFYTQAFVDDSLRTHTNVCMYNTSTLRMSAGGIYQFQRPIQILNSISLAFYFNTSTLEYKPDVGYGYCAYAVSVVNVTVESQLINEVSGNFLIFVTGFTTGTPTNAIDYSIIEFINNPDGVLATKTSSTTIQITIPVVSLNSPIANLQIQIAVADKLSVYSLELIYRDDIQSISSYSNSSKYSLNSHILQSVDYKEVENISVDDYDNLIKNQNVYDAQNTSRNNEIIKIDTIFNISTRRAIKELFNVRANYKRFVMMLNTANQIDAYPLKTYPETEWSSILLPSLKYVERNGKYQWRITYLCETNGAIRLPSNIRFIYGMRLLRWNAPILFPLELQSSVLSLYNLFVEEFASQAVNTINGNKYHFQTMSFDEIFASPSDMQYDSVRYKDYSAETCLNGYFWFQQPQLPPNTITISAYYTSYPVKLLQTSMIGIFKPNYDTNTIILEIQNNLRSRISYGYVRIQSFNSPLCSIYQINAVNNTPYDLTNSVDPINLGYGITAAQIPYGLEVSIFPIDNSGLPGEKRRSFAETVVPLELIYTDE